LRTSPFGIRRAAITSIKTKPIASHKANVSKARLRFSGEMLFIEKNGKRFNLNGHRIK
jgi:endoglucanase